MRTESVFQILPCALLVMLISLSPPAEAAQYRCADGTVTQVKSVCNSHGGLYAGNDIFCGNGLIEAGEMCDDDGQNSDTAPNACRTDCRRAYCGDDVIDSGEECDGDRLENAVCADFDRNGHKVYDMSSPWFWSGTLGCDNNCRYDVSQCHYCGDGIVQASHEQCDDGNSVDDDGCNNDCTICVALNNNIDVTSDTQICTQNYSADDYGDLGAIIIKAPNLTLDCDGARLTGQGDGIGIYIKRSDNVTVKNCIIDNYEYGIYAEDSDNLQILGMGNRIYNTSDQVVLDNSTALPAPPPTAEKFGTGVSPHVQAMAGQKVQPKRVSSSAGDQLKLNARAVAVKPATGTAGSRPQPGTTTQRARPAPAPVITFPQPGQQFAAPARITAKARFDRKQRVVYALKRIPGERVVKRSARGSFSNIPAGDYCIEVAYAERGGAASRCVRFRVVERRAPVAPIRPLAPLHRP